MSKYHGKTFIGGSQTSKFFLPQKFDINFAKSLHPFLADFHGLSPALESLSRMEFLLQLSAIAS